MFFPTGAAESRAERIEVLRLSLNTPVVAVEELPVGPARAGIALFRASDGRLGLTVAVRAARGPHVACYDLEESVSEREGARVALDAALSFAEGMGFLFDDDVVQAEGGGAALSRWRELLASGPADAGERAAERAAPGRARGTPRAGGGVAEILLEDLAAETPAPGGPLRVPALGPLPGPGLPLSKFRRVAAGDRPGVRLVPAERGTAAEADAGIRLITRF